MRISNTTSSSSLKHFRHRLHLRDFFSPIFWFSFIKNWPQQQQWRNAREKGMNQHYCRVGRCKRAFAWRSRGIHSGGPNKKGWRPWPWWWPRWSRRKEVCGTRWIQRLRWGSLVTPPPSLRARASSRDCWIDRSIRYQLLHTKDKAFRSLCDTT